MRPAGEAQRHHGVVHIGHRGERGVHQHRAGRVHLGHRLVDQPGHRVQVVDQAVPEQPARGGHELAGRRQVVVAHRAHQVDRAGLAGAQPPVQFDGGRVEPALEADQHRDPAGLDLGDQRGHRGQVGRERLLAEHRRAGGDGPADQVRVRVGGGGHHQPGRAEQLVHGVHGPRPAAQGRGGRRRPAGNRVVQQDLVDLGQGREVGRVHGTDAANPGYCYVHRCGSVPSWQAGPG